MKLILWGVLGVVVLTAMYYWTTYNDLVTVHENVDNQWAQVETQYQRRFDLIPNLVQSVKGIIAQEQSIFTAIADARTRYAGANNANEKATAATEVEGALARLLVVMENYPELTSSENVQTLMVQLEGTENRISVERKRYNDLVRDFNVKIKKVPATWIAASLGYTEKKYFEVVAGGDITPAVNLID